MRLGHVIGTVTLSRQDPSYRGGRFLLVQPCTAKQFASKDHLPVSSGATLVVFDALGAGVGHIVGFTEGSEACKPFEQPTPVDAYNAAIVDEIFYQPPK